MVPPVLKNLIDKLSEINKDKSLSFDFLINKTAIFDDIEIDEKILTLFQEGKLHDYMSKGYKDELDRMLGQVSGRAKDSKLNDEFSDESMDVTTMDIILEIMNSDLTDSSDYMTLITKLSELVNAFLETGRFEEILEIYNVIREQTLGGKFINEASATIEYFFHSDEFVARFVDTLRYLGRQEREGAIRLSRALQRSVIEPLLDALAEEHFSSTRGFLLSVLTGIGSNVVPHAAKRLGDSRWHVVRNMLYLVRECNGKQEISLIRKMIRHKNRIVCLEALKTLLHFKTSDSAPALNAWLQGQDTKLRTGAIKLAGMYKVRDSVPYLIELLEKKDIFGTGAYYKIGVVRALREIGDERAIKPFQDIINAKTIFYKDNLEELKEEIFKGLDNYPFASVRELAESGLASKNKNIKEISEKLLLKIIISTKAED
ncbi:MAG: hypothetical protein A2X59_00560 [Nitrospirae bacterium GWC2_42_7]|nr:MAG: hypothetical protein A2X59_00560 [Nitrospirae bacterium GWC2_42_7]